MERSGKRSVVGQCCLTEKVVGVSRETWYEARVATENMMPCSRPILVPKPNLS